MKTVRPLIILTAVFVLLLLMSCAVYHGIQPVSPMPPKQSGTEDLYGVGFGAGHTVDSLQPTLSWKCESSSNMKYDIIIYTGVAKHVTSRGGFYLQGKEVYYREGIAGCSHHVEQPLEPHTIYVWGVRTRSLTNVGPWSTYDFQNLGQKGKNLWWSFRTPKQ